MKIAQEVKQKLLCFLKTQKAPELLGAYLFCLGVQMKLRPVACLRDKILYSSQEAAIASLEKSGKIWRETEIKIGTGLPIVNEGTKRIYICPFTGKVFADNVYSNPQDAIYDWLAKCPENTERQSGVRVKRFFVSDDLDVIKNYMQPPKKPITKVVFSSAVTGKLYNTKEAVIQDFQSAYLKPMSLFEVQNQNRYQMEESFLQLVESFLQEDKVAGFVEALAEDEVFHAYVTAWVDVDDS
ncbi:DUF2709 domain-containing protein [Candidatus Clavichlamydia salmonicola]|uniref:DUF2709 domain-containing protein n=1 Tax=Candidatus Clavichlamydia salmonicola TaxID=469812 RepID=UPI00189178E0|nr:DUF2709 domain-containing protein [Candidatus Clavichlamydia salmonicola]